MPHEPAGGPLAPNPERRSLLQWLTFGLGGLASLALGLPLVGYFFSSLKAGTADAWIDLGPLDTFPLDQTRLVKFTNPNPTPWDGKSAESAAYVRFRGEGKFDIFAVNCAHLGCPVNWFPQSGLFLCPCHGGVYYQDGTRASGPPPRGLFAYDYEVQGGRLKIWGGHLPTIHDTLRKQPES
jgi:Rieske Fe-S protein